MSIGNSDFSTKIQRSANFALESLIQHDAAEHEESKLATTEAGLIKWMIYETKLEWFAKKSLEYELSNEQNNEFLAMCDELQIKTGFDSVRRFNSKLRKRGEEWRDKIYIDDAPEDGDRFNG